MGDRGILSVEKERLVRSCWAGLLSFFFVLLLTWTVIRSVAWVWLVLIKEMNLVWYLPQRQVITEVEEGAWKKLLILLDLRFLVKQEVGLTLERIGWALLSFSSS